MPNSYHDQNLMLEPMIDNPENEIENDQEVLSLLQQMSLEEKLSQLSGDFPKFPIIIQMASIYNAKPYPAGVNRRLGIPGIQLTDGPRGIVVRKSTSFPVGMARGATWDPELEEQVGEAMGKEARAQGANLVAAPCINLLRHPAWGRAQETYGEDPYHVGELGAAFVRGLQRHAMACVKHFACYSVEDQRFKMNVQISERPLREVYLPHFRRCIDEGAASIMSAYNKVNGLCCSQNYHLLTEILKNEWGFKGFVISDFINGLHDGKEGIQAGLDLEMPFAHHYGTQLKKQVEEGIIPLQLIDAAVQRILCKKIRYSQNDPPNEYPSDLIASSEHEALALKVAVKSTVLLKNEPPAIQLYMPDYVPSIENLFKSQKRDAKELSRLRNQRRGVEEATDGHPILPINPSQLKKLAVFGKLAKEANLGDRGSSMVRPPHTVTLLDGLCNNAAGRFQVIYENGSQVTKCAHIARNSDIAVIVTGLTYKDEGEDFPARGGDRKSLHLRSLDVNLILNIVAANPRTVVVLMGGAPIIMDEWLDYIPAVLMVWYPGMQGGEALAEIIFGDENPGGKLPCTFPASSNELPSFTQENNQIEYGLYHGYRLLDKTNQHPRFPFGYGLSYTSFSYENLNISKTNVNSTSEVIISVDLTNTGERYGEEVVQLYVGAPGLRIEQPVKCLRGFTRVGLAPGDKRTIEFSLRIKDLNYYDETMHTWRIETGTYTIYTGGSSDSSKLLQASLYVYE